MTKYENKRHMDEWRAYNREYRKPKPAKPLTPLERLTKWLDGELRACGVTV